MATTLTVDALYALTGYSSLSGLVSSVAPMVLPPLSVNHPVSLLSTDIQFLEKLHQGQKQNNTDCTVYFRIVPELLLLTTVLPFVVETGCSVKGTEDIVILTNVEEATPLITFELKVYTNPVLSTNSIDDVAETFTYCLY